jgi:cysteine desulfurase
MKTPYHSYLDHAATTPILAPVMDVMANAMRAWANPSSPHVAGRAARALLEKARADIASALEWDGEIILTGGASEAIAIALGRATHPVYAVSSVEHAAVLRVAPDAMHWPVDENGGVILGPIVPGSIIAVQHVNNETGVIQDIAAIAAAVHAAGAYLFCDCAQSAGKMPLPMDADMIAVSAHKLGGPPGVGALLIRDLGLLQAGGGQEKGYRQGTENMPAAIGFATAVQSDRSWIDTAKHLRTMLDAAVRAGGGIVIGDGIDRIPTIASYAIAGLASASQLIRCDMAGIAVSAGSACSSGTLKASPVLAAMGLPAAISECAIRVSFGPQTSHEDVAQFIEVWRGMADGQTASAL